jgi:hypothetical protein
MLTDKAEKRFIVPSLKEPVAIWKFLILAGFSLLIALPLGLMLYIIYSHSLNVPVGDEWGLSLLVIKLHTGGFTWNDFWVPHNEHRILFLRVLLLALAKLGGWDIRKELYTSLLLAALSLLGVWRLARINLKVKWPLQAGLVAFSSLLLFSTTQWENWISGYGLVWFLNNYCGLVAILAVVSWPGWWRGWLAALVASVVASYAIGAGLVLWPVIGLGLLIQKKAWGWRPIVLWGVAGLAVIAFYFYNYHAYEVSDNQQHLSYALQHPQEIIIFILAFIGAPFFRTWDGILPSALSGCVGLALLGFTLYLAWRQAAKSWQQAWLKLLPWLLLMLLAGLNAAVSATNRTSFGLEAATAARYTTLGALFWIGLAASLLNVIPEYYRTSRPGRQISGLAAGTLLSLILVGSYLVGYLHDYRLIVQNSVLYENSLFFVYHYDSAPLETLIPLLPIPHGPETIKELAWSLQQYREGPFQTTVEDYRQSLENRWQNWLTTASYKQYSYTLDNFRLLAPSRPLVHLANNVLEFDTTKTSKMSFYVNDKKLAELRKSIVSLDNDLQILDIQSRNAYYANIEWESSNKQTLSTAITYGLPDPTGWKHFRVIVPDHISGFSLDLHYSQEEPNDNLKIDIYNRE